MSTGKHIVLGVTGSIAAYKSADLIRRFQDKGCRVSVVMTPSAVKFITPLTLASLSGEKVYSNMLDDGQSFTMPHIDLARQADAFVIAPATADVIGKLAHGLAEDIVTCLALTTRAPRFIAPAMNDEMYSNTIVQENCQKLKSLEYKFIEPVDGKLACGTTGVGHLADIDEIVDRVVRDKG